MDVGRLLRLLVRGNRLLNLVVGAIVGLLILGVAIIVVANVYFRYVRNSSIVWAGEATRYFSVWLVFLGIAVAHHRGAHVRITAAVDALPARVGKLVSLVGELALLVLLGAITWYGWALADANLERGQTTPALGMRIGWIYLAIPVGVGLMALQSFEKILVGAYELITRSVVSESPERAEPLAGG